MRAATLYVVLFLLSFPGLCSSEDDLGRLVFANVLWRHGDRTPIDPYPNDPYKNESLWPVPFGQLTNTGKHQHLMLGRWLRNRYADLLPQTYSPYDVYVLSTDVDRALMSAESNLAGLYPPVFNEVWDIKKWTPIPVHTTPETEDSILSGKKLCLKYNFEFNRLLNSPEMKALDRKYAPLYKYLTEMTGREVSSLQEAEFIHGTLFVEELNNKTLPEWTKTVYPDKLRPLAIESFMTDAYNTVLKRLKSGPLLKDMIDHMQKKAKRDLVPDRKLWIYSGHDRTIANLLMTLDVFEPHCPPYAAAVLVELRVNAQNEHVVTIFYKNSTEEPILLTLPGCKAACPLNQFINLTKNVVPDNWERECLVGVEKYQSSADYKFQVSIGIWSSVILVITVLVFIIISYVYSYRDYNPTTGRRRYDYIQVN